MIHCVSGRPSSHICFSQGCPNSSLTTGVSGGSRGGHSLSHVWARLQGPKEIPCAHLIPMYLTQFSLPSGEEIHSHLLLMEYLESHNLKTFISPYFPHFFVWLNIWSERTWEIWHLGISSVWGKKTVFFNLIKETYHNPLRMKKYILEYCPAVRLNELWFATKWISLRNNVEQKK